MFKFPIQLTFYFSAQSATKATFLAAAIRKCGGNEEKGNLLYTAYGSNGQVWFLTCVLTQILLNIDIQPHLHDTSWPNNQVELLASLLSEHFEA